MPGASGGRVAATLAKGNPLPLLQRGKQFGFYPGLQSLGGISTQVAALDGTAATVDRSGSTAAVLAKAGVETPDAQP